METEGRPNTDSHAIGTIKRQLRKPKKKEKTENHSTSIDLQLGGDDFIVDCSVSRYRGMATKRCVDVLEYLSTWMLVLLPSLKPIYWTYYKSIDLLLYEAVCKLGSMWLYPPAPAPESRRGWSLATEDSNDSGADADNVNKLRKRRERRER